MRRLTTTITLVVGLILGSATVAVGGWFEDVPATYTHSHGIQWMAFNGITTGCNPPANDRFCPDRPVTRGELATILKQYHDQFHPDQPPTSDVPARDVPDVVKGG